MKLLIKKATNQSYSDWLIGGFYLHFYKSIGALVCRSVYGLNLYKKYEDATFRFCVNGSYGRQYSEYLSTFIRPFVFIDVGANQGLYSIIAARNKNCTQCFAFEPINHTFKLLCANLLLNELGEKVFAVNAAIDLVEGVGTISYNPLHSGAASIKHRLAGGRDELISRVNHRYLDELVQFCDHEVVIKIDVEGAELEVLDELIGSTIFPFITSIFIEIDELWINLDKVVHIMNSNAFQESFRTLGHGHYDILFERN